MTRPATRPIHLTRLLEMQATGEKIAAVAAHDATCAAMAACAGVECILVGEELAVAYQGHASHEDIGLDALAYHVTNVSMGLRSAQATAWLVCDLPARMYRSGPEMAMRHAGRLLMAGAHMLRLPIDGQFAATASFLGARGVAVCGHLKGLEPGRYASAVGAMVDSGSPFVVLEDLCDEAVVALTSALPQCVTLGQRSGQKTSGQLVPLHALLGLTANSGVNAGAAYLASTGSIQQAVAAYVADVKANTPVRAWHGAA